MFYTSIEYCNEKVYNFDKTQKTDSFYQKNYRDKINKYVDNRLCWPSTFAILIDE